MGPTAERWIREKRALPLPMDFSTGFEKFLDTLPWLGSGLDWSRMPCVEAIDASDPEPRAILRWAKRTRIGSHSHMAIWYSAKQGGLVVGIEVGLASLDELYRDAPGVRFAFGVDLYLDQLEPAYGDLLQYGSGDRLIAVGI